MSKYEYEFIKHKKRKITRIQCIYRNEYEYGKHLMTENHFKQTDKMFIL